MTTALGYRFDHVHVFCSDIDATERWFVEGMGAEVVEPVAVNPAGPRQAVLRLGGATVLMREPREGENLPRPGSPHLGTDHMGLAVDDLEAAAAELKRRGVRFTMEPTQLPSGVRIAFISGPDDVRIELVQRG